MNHNPDSEAGYAHEDPPLPPDSSGEGMGEQMAERLRLADKGTVPLQQVLEHLGIKQDNAIKVSVSATQKVNTGNYESVDVFFALSNVPVGATDEDLAAAMVTSELVFTHVKAKVGEKVAAILRNVR